MDHVSSLPVSNLRLIDTTIGIRMSEAGSVHAGISFRDDRGPASAGRD
jgi:hypothetical protein